MFRGKIFEWGMGKKKTYKTDRSPSDCSITWDSDSKGTSRCLLSDVDEWVKGYQDLKGEYSVWTNNCHMFVNELVKYLNTNCGH